MEAKQWKLFSFILWKLSICLKRLYRTRKRPCLLFALALILATTSAYWFLIRQDPFKYPDIKSTNDLVERRLQELISSQNGTGCVMPVLDPFSDEAMQFTKDVGSLVCEGVDWVECYKSECQATKHIQSQMRDLVCTYRDIMFLTDYENRIGEPVKVYGGDKYVLSRSDNVKVSCVGTDVDGLGIISSRWFGYKSGLRPVSINTDSHQPAPNSNISIMVMMFDSTSRNGFIRRMPKSYDFLVKELKAVVMKSHNIVMDATPGALFPLLTGHLELELPDSRRTITNHRFVDDTPFIFRLLKEHGGRTAYFEDMPWIGTFQYRFNGFKQQPTDHYLRPLFVEESRTGLKWWTGVNKRHCLGATPQHRLMLNLSSQFLELDGKKFGMTSIVGITHEDFNLITFADEDLVVFLRRFNETGDTVLIVMGDHGPRFSAIRNTFQGKIEERLPFVSLVLPEKLKRSRPEALKNLIANSEVLTTHYDLHATFLDIFDLKDHRNRYKVPGSGLERGLSLLEPIIKNRSCAEAGIMPHWCACTKWQEVSSADPLYNRAAQALADYIDSLTTDFRSQCATRTLSSIQGVLRQSPDDSMLGFKGRREVDRYIGKYELAKHVKASNEYYQATIIMDPGQSIFEGSMQYIVKEDIFTITVQAISRINPYGDEPKCVRDKYPHINKYCFCK